jgi:hypothetical protein
MGFDIAPNQDGGVNTIQASPRPSLEVGFNYAWPFNRYGTTIGPRDIENNPPLGTNQGDMVCEASLDRNLRILRDTLKIRKVRMFLMGNAFNYGARPLPGLGPQGSSFFDAPQVLHPLFLSHFQRMLEIFARNEMQMLPSLLDFGAFYPFGSGMGGGRTSLLTSQRTVFCDTVVRPLVKASLSFKSAIFAWEVMNEPFWNTLNGVFFNRPHTGTTGPDCDFTVMRDFLQACLDVIEQDFPDASTVGHRFFDDTRRWPKGTLPQFHYYGRTGALQILGGINDPNPIPPCPDGKTFIGEFGAAPGGQVNRFGDTEPGDLWPELQGRDTRREDAVFERLKLLESKGYKLAFAWPDVSDKDPDVFGHDALKLSSVAMTSIKRFTSAAALRATP